MNGRSKFMVEEKKRGGGGGGGTYIVHSNEISGELVRLFFFLFF